MRGPNLKEEVKMVSVSGGFGLVSPSRSSLRVILMPDISLANAFQANLETKSNCGLRKSAANKGLQKPNPPEARKTLTSSFNC